MAQAWHAYPVDMGIVDDLMAPDGWHAALAALAWQTDLGASEAIGNDPVNRYDLPEATKPLVTVALPAPGMVERTYLTTAAVPVAANHEAAILAARVAAQSSETLAELQTALQNYLHCDLKNGARNLVFSSGNAAARVMIITDPPDVAEDRDGRPFAGKTGVLFDRMFAAIGLSRTADDPAAAVYITPAMPWRTPQDSDPADTDLDMLRPFLDRHIALVNPEIIVLMGNTPVRALLGSSGILRLRGVWGEVAGKPALPMLHPSHLLQAASAKRDAWADLLALQSWLRKPGDHS